jgi:hypothetical protein
MRPELILENVKSIGIDLLDVAAMIQKLETNYIQLVYI